jgi:hypothetical protein
MEPDEITVTVEVPPVETATPEPETVVVVETPPEPTLPTIVELAQQIAALHVRVDELTNRTEVAKITADVAQSQAETAIDIAISAEAEVVVDEIVDEPTIPEIEEITPEVVAEEMPEIEHRQKKRSRFIE